MDKRIKLGIFFILAATIVFQYGPVLAVVPYPAAPAPAVTESVLQEPVKQLNEGLKKHEEENTQTFHEIKDQLRILNEQNALLAKEEKSWKLVTTGLFLLNFLLCIFLGLSLYFRSR